MVSKNAPLAAFILGLTSLVLGWIPIFGWILCVIAIIFGVTGLMALQGKKTKETSKLRTYAWIGIICGAIPLLVWIFIGIFFISILSAVFSILPAALPLIPDVCTVDDNFLCTGASVTQDGLSLSLLNNMDEHVDSVIVSAGGQCAPRDVPWAPGEEITFTCPTSQTQQRVITVTFRLPDEQRYHTTDGFVRTQ